MPRFYRTGMPAHHSRLPFTITRILSSQSFQSGAREIIAVLRAIQQNNLAAAAHAVIEIIVFVRQQLFVKAAKLAPQILFETSESDCVNGFLISGSFSQTILCVANAKGVR